MPQPKTNRLNRRNRATSKCPVGRPLQQYIVTNPKGKVFKVDNMPEFCRKKKLDPAAMYRIASGQQETHRDGWKCEKPKKQLAR